MILDKNKLFLQLCRSLRGHSKRESAEKAGSGIKKTNSIALSVKPQNVIVEFGSPNIAKPLHMGHVRSTVTGHYVARICKHAGHKVTSMCFLGDWGSQFGVLQAGLAKWITSESVEESVNKLDIRSLLDYYVRAAEEKERNEEFAKQVKIFSSALEQSDTFSLKIWSTIREKTLNHLKTSWDQFGINYDIIQGESEFSMKSDDIGKALAILNEKGLLTSDPDGCVYMVVPANSKDGKTRRVPLVKSDGSSLYLLRDIAAAKNRFENFQFDRMIYIVDKAQSQHFSTLFYILRNFGYEEEPRSIIDDMQERSRKVQHVSFGRMQGMSSRSGNFFLLSDAVREGSELMEASRKESPNTRWEADENVSLQLTLSALIVYLLKSRRNRDFKFDWSEAIRPIGETGIKLQYTHARLKSLEEKQSFDAQVFMNPQKLDVDYILSEPVALDLTLHLVKFEEVFWASYHDLEPCILLTYLFKLCDKTSKALKELPVKTEGNRDIAETRLILFGLSRHLLAIGMDVIGIKPLNQI